MYMCAPVSAGVQFWKPPPNKTPPKLLLCLPPTGNTTEEPSQLEIIFKLEEAPDSHFFLCLLKMASVILWQRYRHFSVIVG